MKKADAYASAFLIAKVKESISLEILIKFYHSNEIYFLHTLNNAEFAYLNSRSKFCRLSLNSKNLHYSKDKTFLNSLNNLVKNPNFADQFVLQVKLVTVVILNVGERLFR